MGSKKRKGLASKAENYHHRVKKYITEEQNPTKKSKNKTKKRVVLDDDPAMRALQVESELSKRATEPDPIDANKIEEQFAQEHEAAPFVDIITIAKPLDMMREHPSYKKVTNSSEKNEIPTRVFGIGGLDTLETFLTSCEELRDKTFNRGGHEVRDIPQVSRQDYQQTLFVPHGLASQPCVNGTLCVGYKCFGDFLGQPLMRYYAPDEMRLLKDNMPVSAREQSCRLCEIFAIHSLVMHSNMKIYNINYQLGRSIPKVGVGEYDESCVLKAAQYASNGLFGPQLSFNLNDYKPVYGVTTITSPTVISKFVVPNEREAFQAKYPNAFLVPGLMDCSPGLVNVTTYASSLIDRPPPINPYTVCVRRPEQALTPRLPIYLYFRARNYENLALVFKDFEQLMDEDASVLSSCYAYLEREGIVRLDHFGYHAAKSDVNFETQKFYVIAFLSVSVYCNATEKRTSRVNTMLRSIPEYVSTHLETVYRGYSAFFNYLRNTELETGSVVIPTDEYLRTTFVDQRSMFSQFAPKFEDYYANVQELSGLNMLETTYKNPTPIERLLKFYKTDDRETLHTIAVPEWKYDNAIEFMKQSELYHRGSHLIDATATEVRTFLARENALFEQLKCDWPYVLDEFDSTLKSLRDEPVRDRILRCYDITSVLPTAMRDYAREKDSGFWNAHRILFTLTYRVFVCQSMYRIEKRSVPVRQAWLLLMNSHLDLCLYMNTLSDMSDVKLTDRHDKIVDDATIKLPDFNSPYRFYYPYSYRERTPGDMPNYVNRLNRITWSNAQQINSRISFEAIGFKVTRRCCENRDLNKHLIEACYESDELRDYILRSLSLSMKGLYEWCTNAPSFQIMLEIHAIFEHHHVPANFERAMRFISRCTFKSDTGKTKEYSYQNLCTNAMAENMYYMLQFNLPLMNILRKLYPYWFFDDVIELMNLARMQNDYSVEAVTRVFKTLKREDRGVYRFVHQSFVDFYLKCSHEFSADASRRKRRSFTLEEQEQIINFIVDRMPLDYSDIDFNSFKLLGCCAQSIEALIRIHLKHQNILNCKRNPDSKQTQNLELAELFSEIEYNDRRAFDCFFNTLLKRKNISIIKIWSDWFVNKQVAQLERNFNDKITEAMTSLAVAPCCDLSVRTVCPEAFGTPTVGTKSTSYDTCSKQVICDKRSHRNVNAKPREPIQFYPAIGNIIQIKRTVTGVTKEKKKVVTSTPAQPTKPPKPRLQSPITLQPCCSNFGTLRTENFSPSGEYLCDLCRKHSKNHQSFEKPSCIGCGEMIVKNNAVKLNERFHCTTCMRVCDTQTCLNCGEGSRFTSIPATRMAMFAVIMDRSASHEIINAYLCKTCYSPWQGCGLQVFVYSALKIVAFMDTSSAKKDMVERFCRGL